MSICVIQFGLSLTVRVFTPPAAASPCESNDMRQFGFVFGIRLVMPLSSSCSPAWPIARTATTRMSKPLDRHLGARPEFCHLLTAPAQNFAQSDMKAVELVLQLGKPLAKFQTLRISRENLSPPISTLGLETFRLHNLRHRPQFGSGLTVELDRLGGQLDGGFYLPVATRCGRPGDQFVSLSFERPMIDASGLSGTLQRAIHVTRPLFPPVIQKRLVVPGSLFRTEPGLAHDPCGEQNVSMLIPVVPFPRRGMKGDVGDHTALDEICLGEGPNEINALVMGQFARQGQLDFPGKLRVAPTLRPLDSVPQCLPVEDPTRRNAWCQNLGVSDAVTSAIVKIQPRAIIAHPLTRTICSRGRNRASCATTDHLRGKPITRHRQQTYARPARAQRQSPPNRGPPNFEVAEGNTAFRFALTQAFSSLPTAQRRRIYAMYKRAILLFCQS